MPVADWPRPRQRLLLGPAPEGYPALAAGARRASLAFCRAISAHRRRASCRLLLVPLTRGQDSSAALQFEVALDSLDQLERVRHDGGPDEDIGDLMHAFSEILLAPPAVEILRVDEAPVAS